MSFTESVQSCIAKILSFEGRARRSEYWYFVLFVAIVTSVLNVLLGTYSGIGRVISIALSLATISVGVRRLHDIGKSGWWYLLCLVPFIGWIVLLVWNIKDSQPGDNQYGPNPKGIYGNTT